MSPVTSPLEYLQSLSPVTLNRLYTSSSTCLAVFRMLVPTAQQYLMRLLLVRHPIDSSLVQSWSEVKEKRKLAKTRHQQAMQILRKLELFIENGASISLNEVFQEQLFNGLSLVPDIASFGRRCSADGKDAMSIVELDTFSRDSWERILHFMVGSTFNTERPSDAVLELLNSAGFMSHVDGQLHITNTGFQFLLQDIYTQLWQMLLQYAETAEQRGFDVVDVLHFCFFLGSLDCGRAYSVENFSAPQLAILNDLKDFGLVYQRKKSSKLLYPTRFASLLTINRSSHETMSRKEDSFIVIETNYRIYAYTNSPLQISVLGLFVNLKSRFANMVVGIITRDSIRRALFNGITAAQIIHYLTTHAHPQLQNHSPIIPPTVVDQINLWELERNRLDISEALLYTDFFSEEEYQEAAGYATELGVLLWAGNDPQKRMMAVTKEGHNAVRAFVKTLIANRQEDK